ncbi:ferredoxin reductase domain-containing protein [Arthrobacter pigmenti]
MLTPSDAPTSALHHNDREDIWELSKLPRKARPKATAGHYRILEHRSLADRYMALTLDAPAIAQATQPGQFLMLTAARRGQKTPALPRPMAIYSTDIKSGTIEVLYGVVGSGTKVLQSFEQSEEMFVVGPLGRSFEIPEGTRRVLLIGRGIGTCSLTTVAQANSECGIETIAVTSAREPSAVIGADYYRTHGAHVYEVTDQAGNSAPEALFATLTRDLDNNPPELILTCGSDRLTRLSEDLAQRWRARVQVSVEAHMACGLGYCHGCASGARSEGDESPLICNDGPVFSWEPVPAGVSAS